MITLNGQIGEHTTYPVGGARNICEVVSKVSLFFHFTSELAQPKPSEGEEQ
jgi:hypothetical protein